MRCCLAACLSVIAAGCGSDQVDTYPVSGKVVFADGEPVRLGTVEFESVSFGTTASGKIKEDGSFVLGTYTSTDGAASGKHRAIVVQIVVNDGTFRHVKDHGRPVPLRYGNYATSGLSVVIFPEDSNNVLLELDRQQKTER